MCQLPSTLAGVLCDLSTAAKHSSETAGSTCPEQQAPDQTSLKNLMAQTDRSMTQHSGLTSWVPFDMRSCLPHNLSACEQEAAVNLDGMLQTEHVSRVGQLNCVLQVEAMRPQDLSCLPSLIARFRKVQGCTVKACCRLRPEAALQQQPGFSGNSVSRA